MHHVCMGKTRLVQIGNLQARLRTREEIELCVRIINSPGLTIQFRIYGVASTHVGSAKYSLSSFIRWVGIVDITLTKQKSYRNMATIFSTEDFSGRGSVNNRVIDKRCKLHRSYTNSRL
jgi:hypothetical protein